MASVVILYSAIPDHPHREKEVSHDEVQARQTVQAVEESLHALGHTVTLVRAVATLCDILDDIKPDAILNLAAGIHRKQEQANVIGMLEMSPFPFTGSGLVTNVVALDKATAKQVFAWHGVPTPGFQVFKQLDEPLAADLYYPLLVKPVREGSGIGIHLDAVVVDETELRDRIARILTEYRQPALVEEYIDGRELTVGVLGNEDARVLPIMEIHFDAAMPPLQRIYSYEIKVADMVGRSCPARLTPEETSSVQKATLMAYRALGCRDYARIDLRLSPTGVPYVLEINTLPGLQPGYSEFPRLAAVAGWGYTELIGHLLTLALKRGQI